VIPPLLFGIGRDDHIYASPNTVPRHWRRVGRG
jgi:hypothetical protein